MDVGTGGTRGAHAPTFQRFGQSAPFHEIWLSSLKALKMQKHLVVYQFSAI